MGRSWASSRKRDVGLATCVLRQVCHSRESAAALNACHLSRSTRMSFEEASRMSELMSGRGYACVECSVVFEFDRRAIRFAFCDFRATTHVDVSLSRLRWRAAKSKKRVRFTAFNNFFTATAPRAQTRAGSWLSARPLRGSGPWPCAFHVHVLRSYPAILPAPTEVASRE